MMGQTHLAGGVALAIAAEAASQRMGFTLFDSAITLDIESGLNVAAAVGVAAIASLLPDLDHAKSKASNLNLITRMISAVVRGVTTHRSGTHWLLTCLFFTGIIYLVQPSLAIWFFIGYASHLLLDMMTLAGVKILRPFSSRTYYVLPKFFRFRTGGMPEIGFRFLCWLLALSLFTWQALMILEVQGFNLS